MPSLDSKISLIGDVYGHAKATWILSNILAKRSYLGVSPNVIKTFLPVSHLADMNTYFTPLNMDLSGANITKNLVEYIDEACGVSEPIVDVPVKRFVTSTCDKASIRVPMRTIPRRPQSIDLPRNLPGFPRSPVPDDDEESGNESDSPLQPFERAIVPTKVPDSKKPITIGVDIETQTIVELSSKNDSETQTASEGSKETEDLRIKLAVSLVNEAHQGVLAQEMHGRITEIKETNAMILDTLAENHAFAIRELDRDNNALRKEVERLRSIEAKYYADD